MKIIDCEQDTEPWHLARAGLATASNFAAILSKGNEPQQIADALDAEVGSG